MVYGDRHCWIREARSNFQNKDKLWIQKLHGPEVNVGLLCVIYEAYSDGVEKAKTRAELISSSDRYALLFELSCLLAESYKIIIIIRRLQTKVLISSILVVAFVNCNDMSSK